MRSLKGFLVFGLTAALLVGGCSGTRNAPQGSGGNTVVEGTRTVSGKEPSGSVTPTGTVASAEATLVTSGKGNLASVIEGSSELSTYERLYKASGLLAALKKKRQLTVLAPNNDAFSELGTATVEALLRPENKEKLKTLLRYHLIMHTVPSEQMVNVPRMLTFQGGRVTVKQEGSSLVLNGTAVVLNPDVKAKNGLLHVINVVLLPPGFKV